MSNRCDTEQFDAVDRLQVVRDLVALHASDEVSGWFCDGVDQWLLADGSLSDCLGLGSVIGERHLAFRYAMYKRNQHIHHASMQLGVCDNDVVKRLIEEISSFENRWEDISGLDGPSREWSKLKKALFWAFKYGEEMNRLPPKSPRQLSGIILKIEQAGRDAELTPHKEWLYKR